MDFVRNGHPSRIQEAWLRCMPIQGVYRNPRRLDLPLDPVSRHGRDRNWCCCRTANLAFGFEPAHPRPPEAESDARAIGSTSRQDQLPNVLLSDAKSALAESVNPETFSIPFNAYGMISEVPVGPVSALTRGLVIRESTRIDTRTATGTTRRRSSRVLQGRCRWSVSINHARKRHRPLRS